MDINVRSANSAQAVVIAVCVGMFAWVGIIAAFVMVKL